MVTWIRRVLAGFGKFFELEGRLQDVEDDLERFRAQVTEINKKLFSYNLEVPSSQFQRLPVSFEQEVESLTQGTAE